MLEVLEQRESWSRDEIESYQLDRINDKLAACDPFAFPFYGQQQAELKLPPQFKSLAEYQALMPVLSKVQLRDQPAAFLSRRCEPGRWFRTGGSTGIPTSIYWSHQAHRESLRRRYRCQAMWGVDFLDRHAMLWGHAAILAPGIGRWVARLRQPLEDRLRNRRRLSAYRLGPSAFTRLLAAAGQLPTTPALWLQLGRLLAGPRSACAWLRDPRLASLYTHR